MITVNCKYVTAADTQAGAYETIKMMIIHKWPTYCSIIKGIGLKLELVIGRYN